MTVGLVKAKEIKEKVVRVETVIDDGYDEIVDLISDDQNNTETVSSSVQFAIDNSDDEFDNESGEESDSGILCFAYRTFFVCEDRKFRFCEISLNGWESLIEM